MTDYEEPKQEQKAIQINWVADSSLGRSFHIQLPNEGLIEVLKDGSSFKYRLEDKNFAVNLTSAHERLR